MELSSETLYEDDIIDYVNKLKIPYFVGVMMRDELSIQPKLNECGILNLNNHYEQGSHWICWHKRGNVRFYFESFAESPPIELLYYLKTTLEFTEDLPCIICNAVTVQHDENNECGSLCLFILKNLSLGLPFPDVLTFLQMRYENSNQPLKIEI